MRNQIFCKMFYFILFLLFNCLIINCISLIGSKIISHNNINRIIHASLTDKDSGRVWQIQEELYSGSLITGRIEIKSTETQANVFYSYKSPMDNKKRLVIYDNTCDFYTYDLNWGNLLPGVNKPLTNLILLLGPSLLDRITEFDWENGNDENIRGSLMHSLSTVLDGKLNITLYYRNGLNQINGVQQPSQIVFTGHNPDTLVEGAAETLILDIYLQSQEQQNLNKLVQVTPGFGCPVYLNGDKDFPEINAVKIHFIAAEQVNQDEIIMNEFHADEAFQVLRQSELLELGYKRDKLFDFLIGARYYKSNSGIYQIAPINSRTPGIDERGTFSMAKLLWLSKNMKYLGEIIYEHRSGYNVHVWESTETNRVINDKPYDKVVTAQYLSSSYKNDVFKGYSPVAASIKAYKKTEKGAYVLSYTNHRDYYDFNSELAESAYHRALQMEDFNNNSRQKLNLKFHLMCTVDGCIKKSQNSIYKMKELFRSNLLGQLKISSTRVADIELKFQKEVIEIFVTFLEAPRITDVLPMEKKTINPTSFVTLHETVAESDEQCLRYHASFIPTGAAIIYCRDGKVCTSITNGKDVQESESGAKCSVFTDPYKKLNRLGQEKPLSDLHDHLLDHFGHITFDMDLDAETKAVTFRATDVFAINEGDDERKKTYRVLYYFSKYDKLDGIHTVMVPGVERFGDCYHACSHNEDISCRTFAFCNSRAKKECYVSSWSEPQIENNRTMDSDCMIFSKNYLFDFNLQANLKYKHPISVFKESHIEDCAAECYASKDCVSFQFCSSNKCSFSDSTTLTASKTEFSTDCDIYTPKRSRKYTVTGETLVSKVLYTEVELDLDQCATLCDNELSCKSFNYCPKSKSLSKCQITSYSIRDPKTESIETSICHNFELTFEFNKKNDNNSSDIKASGVRSGGVFGIVMLFLLIGLFAGFAGPCVFTKIKSRVTQRSEYNFGWSKQENVDENVTQI